MSAGVPSPFGRGEPSDAPAPTTELDGPGVATIAFTAPLPAGDGGAEDAAGSSIDAAGCDGGVEPEGGSVTGRAVAGGVGAGVAVGRGVGLGVASGVGVGDGQLPRTFGGDMSV